GLAPVPVNPLNKADLQNYVEPVLGRANKDWQWQTIQDYFNELDQQLISENVASYVAHGSVRISVMGFDNRSPTQQELEEMKHIVEEGMKAGAIGLSIDRKSTRLNSSHVSISYAVFCLKKKNHPRLA